MSKEEIQEYISIVERALNEILLAERTINKRTREKAICEAKTEAQNLVLPYREMFEEELDLDYNGELFSWGFIENDLRTVREKLSEMMRTNK